MNKKNSFIDDTINFIKSEVCSLTDRDECERVINDYNEHQDPLLLVDETFKVIMKCDKDICLTNKDNIKEKIEKYLKKHMNE